MNLLQMCIGLERRQTGATEGSVSLRHSRTVDAGTGVRTALR